MRNNIVFREYISNLFNAIQADIELNNETMKWNLRKEILATLAKPKDLILDDISSFNKYDFRAFQVIYHLIERNEDFNRKFNDLFIQNFINQLLKKQTLQLQSFLIMIRQAEDVTVLIENELDFCVPQKFSYITKNIYSIESLKTLSESIPESKIASTDVMMSEPRPALVIFKTEKRGWGIKALTKITNGENSLNHF